MTRRISLDERDARWLYSDDEDAEKRTQKARRLTNEARTGYVHIPGLETDSTLQKAGENFAQVDDLLTEAFEKQIWEDDLAKAPDMWERDDNVPQFVRSHVKKAIDETDALYTEFDDIPHAAALTVHKIIRDQLTNPQGWSVETVTKELADEFDQLTLNEAEDIARTEVAAVLNKAKELALDARDAAAAANQAQNITGLPDQDSHPAGGGGEDSDVDDVQYYWTGPEDHRTTNICSETKDEIEARGGYVPKDELKAILRENAKQYKEEDGGLPERVESFVPHFNCRHTFIREDYRKIT